MSFSQQFSVSTTKLKLQKGFNVLCLVLCFFSFLNAEAQYDIPEKPSFQTSVYDYANLLSDYEKKSLEDKLVRYSDTTSTQIVMITILSTKGEDINYLGAQWGEKWGVGQEKEDNGILILLAKNDRRISINTGYGVEHLLTDAMSKRIIERDIIPYFKRNNYPGGLNRGVDAIFEVLTGEYQGTRQNNNGGFPVGLFFFLFIIFLFIIIAISNRKRGGGNSGGTTVGTGSLLEAIILSNMGRGSYRSGSGRSSGGFGGFGSGSSGGFGGGFGGGSFGGGGASGGW